MKKEDLATEILYAQSKGVEITWEDWVKKIDRVLDVQKQELIENIYCLISEEMLVCHKENTPTSRLTSLVGKISKLKE